MRETRLEVDFREEEIWKRGEQVEKVEKDWSGCRKELKKGMKKRYEEKLNSELEEKVMKSQVFVG